TRAYRPLNQPLFMPASQSPPILLSESENTQNEPIPLWAADALVCPSVYVGGPPWREPRSVGGRRPRLPRHK
ncbi:MAG: hypothetical protein KAJ19_11065, partial [Gammaproteobacteria bacterium]|nr:hypothetical protein [Gammaproteobacteria bacterium]